MIRTASEQSFVALLRDARRARKAGPSALAERQRARLAELVSHVRAYSPYYRELYRDLPERGEDASLLSITDKKNLMARFDDWSADRASTILLTSRWSETQSRQKNLGAENIER